MHKILIFILTFIISISCHADEYKVGVILGLTGPAQQWGEQARRGLELAKDEINESGGVNGKKIKLIYEDSKTDPKTAATALNKLIHQDQVVAVFGGIWDLTAAPLAAIAKREKIVVITPNIGESAQKDNPYFYAIGPFISFIDRSISTYFRKHPEIKSAVSICPFGPWGETNQTAFNQIAKKFDVKILDSINHAQNDTDFRVESIRIKSLNPDLVFVCYQSNLLAKRFAVLKFKTKLLSTTDTVEAVSARDFPKNLAEGIHYSYWPASDDFTKKFEQAYDRPTFYLPQNPYEALRSIAKALEIDPDNIAESIKKVAYTGTGGKVDFTKGTAVNHTKAQLFYVKNGNFLKY